MRILNLPCRTPGCFRDARGGRKYCDICQEGRRARKRAARSFREERGQCKQCPNASVPDSELCLVCTALARLAQEQAQKQPQELTTVEATMIVDDVRPVESNVHAPRRIYVEPPPPVEATAESMPSKKLPGPPSPMDDIPPSLRARVESMRAELQTAPLSDGARRMYTEEMRAKTVQLANDAHKWNISHVKLGKALNLAQPVLSQWVRADKERKEHAHAEIIAAVRSKPIPSKPAPTPAPPPTPAPRPEASVSRAPAKPDDGAPSKRGSELAQLRELRRAVEALCTVEELGVMDASATVASIRSALAKVTNEA